jgi:4-amino-4-deoxy-L-arabinose transferase-like glycosyltransferase
MHFKKALIPEYLFFLITLLFVIFVRFRFSDMAMERDEGEYACSAAQILRGGFPYLDFYNMKLPGVYYCYATVFFCFGKSIQAIRFCVLCLTIVNCFLIKRINEQWFDEREGWLAAGVYLLAAPLAHVHKGWCQTVSMLYFSKIDEAHNSEAAMLIFEREDSLSLNPLKY